MPASTALKLRARDAEDLRALATVLQDALVPVKDMAYLKREKRFVLVVNRFMWETAPQDPQMPPPLEGDAGFADEAPPPPFSRVNCGIVFDRVRGVRTRGLNLTDRDQILNLLTVEVDNKGVVLLFSGGAAIRLDGQGIHCHLEDLGEPWPTDRRPEHADDAPADRS